MTSEPDHTSIELTPSDKFIILASDGVWEFISSKEAVEIVAQYDSAEEACRQVCAGTGISWPRTRALLSFVTSHMSPR